MRVQTQPKLFEKSRDLIKNHSSVLDEFSKINQKEFQKIHITIQGDSRRWPIRRISRRSYFNILNFCMSIY